MSADEVATALVVLVRAGIPPDIQKLLVQGDPMRGIAPGALSKAIAADRSRPAESGGKVELAAWQRLHPTEGWTDVRLEDVGHYARQGQAIRPLYAIPLDAATITALRAENARLAAELAEARRDTARLDAIRNESWDVRCFDSPTGGDDADIGWRVIGHWMAEPHERVVGEVYSDDPRAAIDDAIARDFLTRTGASHD